MFSLCIPGLSPDTPASSPQTTNMATGITGLSKRPFGFRGSVCGSLESLIDGSVFASPYTSSNPDMKHRFMKSFSLPHDVRQVL